MIATDGVKIGRVIGCKNIDGFMRTSLRLNDGSFCDIDFKIGNISDIDIVSDGGKEFYLFPLSMVSSKNFIISKLIKNIKNGKEIKEINDLDFCYIVNKDMFDELCRNKKISSDTSLTKELCEGDSKLLCTIHLSSKRLLLDDENMR